jgi:hypothetical protein
MLGALGLANGGVLSPVDCHADIGRNVGRPESGWSELPDVTPHQNMAELTRGTKREAQ